MSSSGRTHATSPQPRARQAPPRCRARVALVLAAGLAALVTGLGPLGEAVREITLPLRHDDIIRQQAADKDLDPALIAAVIYEESRFRDQTSHAGARGLMQITPDTAEFIARHSGGYRFEQADLATPADQHRLRLLLPALPARPLRRQRGCGAGGVQRRHRERRQVGRRGRRDRLVRRRARTFPSPRRAPTSRTCSTPGATITITTPTISEFNFRAMALRAGRR